MMDYTLSGFHVNHCNANHVSGFDLPMDHNAGTIDTTTKPNNARNKCVGRCCQNIDHMLLTRCKFEVNNVAKFLKVTFHLVTITNIFKDWCTVHKIHNLKIILCVRKTYSHVMAEHVSRQAFADFGCYDLVKPLEVWCAKLCIQNDNRSIGIGSWVFVITFEKVRLWPERERVKSIIRSSRSLFYRFITVASELYFSLFTSQVLFSAVLLNFLHHMSFLHGCWKMLSSQRGEAHWTLSKKAKQKDLSHTFSVHVEAFKSTINQLPGTCWKECTVAEYALRERANFSMFTWTELSIALAFFTIRS